MEYNEDDLGLLTLFRFVLRQHVECVEVVLLVGLSMILLNGDALVSAFLMDIVPLKQIEHGFGYIIIRSPTYPYFIF